MGIRTPFTVYKEIIEGKGGTCLSTSCNSGNTDRISIRCAAGHEWEALGRKIKQGQWCFKCARKKLEESKRTPFSVYIDIIKKKNGTCLSTSCNSGRTDKISIRCSNGHDFKMLGQDLKNDRWCHNCLRTNFSVYKQIIEEKEGVCLSTFQGNPSCYDKIEIRCKNGHNFAVPGNSLKYGHWCRECADISRRTTFEVYKEIIKNKGGECLSSYCNTSEDKINIRCAKGHDWSPKARYLIEGRWCPKCNDKPSKHNPIQFKVYKEIIENKRGICLSTSCNGSNDKLSYICPQGHKCTVRARALLANHWCQKCAMKEVGAKRITPFQVYVDIIEKKGGKCLSTSCVHSCKDKLHVRCAKGHEWKISGNSLMSGHWCPDCYIYKHELVCRKYFERFLSKKFVKVRPEWLRPEGKHPLELDGYSEELKLAFEYQGEQHNQHAHYFSGVTTLETRQANDRLKKEMCKANGVDLIEIPYTAKKEIGAYILEQCKQRGLKIINSDISPVKGIHNPHEGLAGRIIEIVRANRKINGTEITKIVKHPFGTIAPHLKCLVNEGILTKQRGYGEPKVITHRDLGNGRRSFTCSSKPHCVYYQLAENNKTEQPVITTVPQLKQEPPKMQEVLNNGKPNLPP